VFDPFHDEVGHDRGCQASCDGKAGSESKAGGYRHNSSEADGANGESHGEIGNTCRTRGLVLPDEGLLQWHRYIPGHVHR
jgi:hypothetical protein